MLQNGIDIQRLGHFAGNYDWLGSNKSPETVRLSHSVMQQSLEVCDSDHWQKLCTNIFKLPKEKILPIDFNSRKIVLINNRVESHQFVYFDRVSDQSGSAKAAAIITEYSGDWLTLSPTSFVLVVSIPANSQLPQSQYYQRNTREISTMNQLREDIASNSDLILKIQSAIAVFREFEPKVPLVNIEKKLRELTENRTQLSKRLGDVINEMRQTLMGPRLN